MNIGIQRSGRRPWFYLCVSFFYMVSISLIIFLICSCSRTEQARSLPSEQNKTVTNTGSKRAMPTSVNNGQPITSPSSNPFSAIPQVHDALIKLDIWLEGQWLKHDLPGFSIGIIHDQDLIWSKGYGLADVDNKIPATDRTLYRVGSITKTFTATAVMQLVEEGKLSLEDPVSTYLPWFTPKEADPSQPIRVWHLLAHTAGLQENPPGTNWDTLESPASSAVYSATRETPLSIPTQTRLKYSNYGFVVAGELVAKLSNISYARYIEEKVLEPIGMTNSFFLDGTQTQPGLAVPYGRRLSGLPRRVEQQMKMQGLISAGGLVTSIQDLSKWASFQFLESDEYKGPVLTGRSIREMHRPRFLVPNWSQGCGIGWWLFRGEKRAEIGHYGIMPGYRSSMLINPSTKVAVIVLINADEGPLDLARGAMKIVSSSIEIGAASLEKIADPGANLAPFEGLYRDRWGSYQRVVVLGGQLRVIDLDADDIDAGTTTLKQIGPTTFISQIPDSAVFNAESIIKFKMESAGCAASFTDEDGSHLLQRVK